MREDFRFSILVSMPAVRNCTNAVIIILVGIAIDADHLPAFPWLKVPASTSSGHAGFRSSVVGMPWVGTTLIAGEFLPAPAACRKACNLQHDRLQRLPALPPGLPGLPACPRRFSEAKNISEFQQHFGAGSCEKRAFQTQIFVSIRPKRAFYVVVLFIHFM